MSEGNYWQRLARKRMSRRGMLRGAVYSGAGFTAAALVGCGGGDDENGNGGAGTTGEPTIQISEGKPGGVYRASSFAFHDTFDPHLTQFGPIYSPLSGIFSKVLMYTDIYQGLIQPDLAEKIEQPEPDQYVITLRANAKYHNKPPVNGRNVDAEDVKFMIERQRDGEDPRFYRKSQWETVKSVEVVDPRTLRITTFGPVAPLQHFLADTNAHVVPRELLQSKNELGTGLQEPSADMIGSGPFMWDKYQTLVEYRAVKNPEWYGWDKPDLGRPYLEGYLLNSSTAADPATRAAAFRSKQIDSAGFGDQPPAFTDDLMSEFPELELYEYGVSGFVNSRFLVSMPPYNDWRVRTAINIVLDRSHMVDTMYFGAAKPNGVISWAIPQWALPDDEVAKYKGRRFDPDQRQQDLAEAKKMWEAAGGNAAIGPLHVVVADIPAYLMEYAPQIQEQMKRELGAEVTYERATYNDIAERLLRGDMGWAFAFDNGWIDLDDWLYPYYYTGAPKNSFNFSDPKVDQLLQKQRETFDYEERRDIGYEIQRYMMDDKVNIHPNWVSPLSRVLVWPYVKNFQGSPWYGNDFRLADLWIDTSNAAYSGRPR